MLAAVMAWYQPAPVARPDPDPLPELPEVPDLVASAVPARYDAWEPFVIEWWVEGTRAEPMSALSANFGQNPCAALPAPACRVRLAWEGVGRWSLTASGDDRFDGLDARQLTTGGLHYAIGAGELLGVVDTDRLPGLHVCHSLAERWADGEALTAEPAGDDTMVFRHRNWGTAHCLGHTGIPVVIKRLGTTWTTHQLERRAPTDDEIGLLLVAGRAAFSPQPGCADAGGGAPTWLLAAARKAGHAATPAGGGIEFLVPGAWQRQACAWVAPGYVPVGARTHRLSDGTVVDELLHPVPMVSAPAGNERLWMAFVDAGPDSRGSRERAVFVLAEAVRRLLTDS